MSEEKYFIEGKLYSKEILYKNKIIRHSYAATKKGSRWVRYIYDSKEAWDKAWDEMIEEGHAVFKPINAGKVGE